MPVSVAVQVAALTAIVERIDSRAEEDRRDHKVGAMTIKVFDPKAGKC